MSGDQSQPFGGWIKALRDAKGLNQAEFANLIGFDRSVISRIESGEKVATADFAVAIAIAFELPADEVLYQAGLLPESALGLRIQGALSDPKTLIEINRLLDQINDTDDRERAIGTIRAVIQAAIDHDKAHNPKAAPKHRTG